MALRLKDIAVPVWLLIAAVLLCAAPAAAATAIAPINNVTVITAQARPQFHVELAATDDARRKGLMHRRVLAKDAGMLFIFPISGRHGFWMKDTLIPLDMLFIAGDGRIVYVHHNAQPHSLTPITPNKDARAVLEINGGLSRRLGIAVGDQVLHPSLTGR
ncbi:MAG: DUF192 domain-containing protein [Proteobacteria bacterium]|nr:DUF192 domain-containing protein [Pseudomonadota bacterium]